jgi:predicted ATP-grasp superfamily ATP-dependent carboligase
LIDRYQTARDLVPAGTIMVQELIAGGGEAQFSFAALCVEGTVEARLIARRRRQRPPDFGQVSTCVETIDDPGLAEPATTLLRALGYTGLVELEFKHDQRDGRFKLLDVNARPWAWLSLGGRAGVDFAYLWWEVVHGRSVPQVSAPAGVRWLHLALDVPTSLRQIARGRLRARDYLASFDQLPEFATLTTDDPLPALAEVRVLARRSLKRRRPPTGAGI